MMQPWKDGDGHNTWPFHIGSICVNMWMHCLLGGRMRRLQIGGTTHPRLSRPMGRFGTTPGIPRPSTEMDARAREAAQADEALSRLFEDILI